MVHLQIRFFDSCPPGGICDWVQAADQVLHAPRWYATDQLLPDGRVIVIGGLNAFSLEFVPDTGEGLVPFPFLFQNQDPQGDNLYPFVHLLPDGNLWIFCNRASILYDYVNNTILQTFPNITGEPRSYPSAGSSVLLPLEFGENFAAAEVLICGGSQYGAFINPGAQLPASLTCGRLRVTDPAPIWIMENMPMRRCMGDMILLPTGSVVIINGAQAGSQGFNNGFDPVFTPLLYQPDAPLGTFASPLWLSPNWRCFVRRVLHSSNVNELDFVLDCQNCPDFFFSFWSGFGSPLKILFCPTLIFKFFWNCLEVR